MFKNSINKNKKTNYLKLRIPYAFKVKGKIYPDRFRPDKKSSLLVFSGNDDILQKLKSFIENTVKHLALLMSPEIPEYIDYTERCMFTSSKGNDYLSINLPENELHDSVTPDNYFNLIISQFIVGTDKEGIPTVNVHISTEAGELRALKQNLLKYRTKASSFEYPPSKVRSPQEERYL